MPLNRKNGLPVRTAFRKNVPGLEVRHDKTGERYTILSVEKDGLVLTSNDGHEIVVDNDEFEDKFSLE